MRYMVFALILVLFGGCAKYVETNVSVFHELKPPIQSATYVLLPSNEQADNLEFQTYAKLIKAELERYGLREASRSNARYGVYLSYGIDGGREVFSSMPVYGHTGVSGIYTSGKTNAQGIYTGVTFVTPRYDVVGSETRSDTVYGSFLYVDIVDLSAAPTPRKVYEGKVSGKSETPFLGAVMPLMVRNMFEEFPGTSGMTRTIRMPLNKEK